MIFTALVGVFLLVLLGYLFFSRHLPQATIICLVLIFAGGVGNLIDRIANDGRVIDFLNIGIGPLRTDIFNVVDMTITFGALLLALRNLPQDNAHDRNDRRKDA